MYRLHLEQPTASLYQKILERVARLSIGMCLQEPDSNQSSMILVKPGGCEAYRLPDSLDGELQGLYLP